MMTKPIYSVAILSLSLISQFSHANGCDFMSNNPATSTAPNTPMSRLIDGQDISIAIMLLKKLKHYSAGDFGDAGSYRYRNIIYTNNLICPNQGILYYKARPETNSVDYGFDDCGIGEYSFTGTSSTFDHGYRDTGFEKINVVFKDHGNTLTINKGAYVLPKSISNSPVEKKVVFTADNIRLSTPSLQPSIVNNFRLSVHRKSSNVMNVIQQTRFETVSTPNQIESGIIVDMVFNHNTGLPVGGTMSLTGSQNTKVNVPNMSRCDDNSSIVGMRLF